MGQRSGTAVSQPFSMPGNTVVFKHDDGPGAWTVGDDLRLSVLRLKTAAGGRGLGNVPGTGNRYAPGRVLAVIGRRGYGEGLTADMGKLPSV